MILKNIFIETRYFLTKKLYYKLEVVQLLKKTIFISIKILKMHKTILLEENIHSNNFAKN